MRATVARHRWSVLAAALVLLFVVVIPIFAEWFAPSARAVVVPPIPQSDVHRVFVADWGYHASIIVEQPAGWRLGPPGQEGAPFVEYAWGDRRFYMEGNHWPHVLFAALLLPTASVTYVEAWNRAPDVATHARRMLVRTIGAEELRRLQISLEGTIRRGAGGERAAPYGVAAGYAGRFYPSIDSYIWSRDCNRWVVDRLTAAGLARGGRGVLFSSQVPGHLVGFTEVVRVTRPAAEPSVP